MPSTEFLARRKRRVVRSRPSFEPDLKPADSNGIYVQVAKRVILTERGLTLHGDDTLIGTIGFYRLQKEAVFDNLSQDWERLSRSDE